MSPESAGSITASVKLKLLVNNYNLLPYYMLKNSSIHCTFSSLLLFILVQWSLFRGAFPCFITTIQESYGVGFSIKYVLKTNKGHLMAPTLKLRAFSDTSIFLYEVYVSVCLKHNKTGLQPVSRPVEQPLLGFRTVKKGAKKCT